MNHYSTEQKKLYSKMALLKLKQKQQILDIKSGLSNTAEYLKPSRLITRTMVELKEEPIFRSSIIQTTLSLFTGFLSRKVIVGKSDSFIRSMIGYISQMMITKVVAAEMDPEIKKA